MSEMRAALCNTNVFPTLQANPVVYPSGHAGSRQSDLSWVCPTWGLVDPILRSTNFLRPTILYIVPKSARNSIARVSIPLVLDQ